MKNIYDELNNIDINLDEYEREDFNDIEKQIIKRNFKQSIKKNINYKKYIAVASVGIVSLGVLYNTSIGAFAYEQITEVAYNIKQALGIKTDLTKYSDNVNQSVTKNGLTVRVKDVLLDGNELLVYLEHEYDKELKANEDIELISERFYVNGEKVNKGVSGYSTIKTKNKTEFVAGYKLPDDISMDEDINIKIKINDAYKWLDNEHDKFKRIWGPWTFKFKVNGSNLVKDTKEIKINKDIKLQNGVDLYIKSYRQNPVNQTITLSEPQGNEKIKLDNGKTINLNEAELVLKGKDDLGNKLTFSLKGGMYYSTEAKYEFDKSNGLFDLNAKSLKLSPYLKINTVEGNNEVTIYKKIGSEFEIDLK